MCSRIVSNADRAGISFRQGEHHVAQKLTTTHLPLCSARSKRLPSTVSIDSAGKSCVAAVCAFAFAFGFALALGFALAALGGAVVPAAGGVVSFAGGFGALHADRATAQASAADSRDTRISITPGFRRSTTRVVSGLRAAAGAIRPGRARPPGPADPRGTAGALRRSARAIGKLRTNRRR